MQDMDPVTRLFCLFGRLPKKSKWDDQVGIIEHRRRKNGKKITLVGEFNMFSRFTREDFNSFTISHFNCGFHHWTVFFNLEDWAITFVANNIVTLEKKEQYRTPKEHACLPKVYKYTLVFPEL